MPRATRAPADGRPRAVGCAAACCRRPPATPERDRQRTTTAFSALLSCLRRGRGHAQHALVHAAGMNASSSNRLKSGERGAPAREDVLTLAPVLDAVPVHSDRRRWGSWLATALSATPEKGRYHPPDVGRRLEGYLPPREQEKP
ncbi:MAG TPA: hypothetical protein VIU62_14280 [Chloroflexota bacterium]